MGIVLFNANRIFFPYYMSFFGKYFTIYFKIVSIIDCMGRRYFGVKFFKGFSRTIANKPSAGLLSHTIQRPPDPYFSFFF